MNEFESLLQSLGPLAGRTNPMQIMFAAGEQSASCRPRSQAESSRRVGAGRGWKIATGIFATTSLVLIFMQFESAKHPASETPTASNSILVVGDFAEKAAIKNVDHQPRFAPGVFGDELPERQLGGIHARHWRQMTAEVSVNAEALEEYRLTPISFHRLRQEFLLKTQTSKQNQTQQSRNHSAS